MSDHPYSDFCTCVKCTETFNKVLYAALDRRKLVAAVPEAGDVYEHKQTRVRAVVTKFHKNRVKFVCSKGEKKWHQSMALAHFAETYKLVERAKEKRTVVNHK